MAWDRPSPPHISVVLPSYNDEPIIRPYHAAISQEFAKRGVTGYELVYVDDGSSDGSQETLAALALEDPKVTYVELFRNFGQQRALFAGLMKSRGRFIITLDGDYQYEPEVIFQLVEGLESGVDLASGIREGRQDGWLEVVSSRIGNTIINRALGIQVKDFGSVKGFSRPLVNELIRREHHFSDVYPSAFALRPKMVEIPVRHKVRPVGSSHWNIWMRFKLYLDLYVSHSDDQFYGLFKFGIINMLTSILFGFLFLVYKLTLSHAATFVELMGISFIWFLLGGMFTAWSLTMSFVVKIYKQNIFMSPISIRRVVVSGNRNGTTNHQ